MPKSTARRIGAARRLACGGLSHPVVAPGERYKRPGPTETQRRRTVHCDVRFLRGLVSEVLLTGAWGHASAADTMFELWLGVDGVPPGLKVSYFFLVDPRGTEGGVWEDGASPTSFYWGQGNPQH